MDLKGTFIMPTTSRIAQQRRSSPLPANMNKVTFPRYSYDGTLTCPETRRQPSPSFSQNSTSPLRSRRSRNNTVPAIVPLTKNSTKQVVRHRSQSYSARGSFCRRRLLVDIEDDGSDSWSNYTLRKADTNSRKFSIAVDKTEQVRSDDRTFSLLILGSENVGKTTLLKHLIRADETYKHRDDLETNVNLIFDVEDETLNISIDVQSGIREKPSVNTFYDAVLVLYSISDRSSFEHSGQLLTLTVLELKRLNPNLSICLLGNKSDLVRARVVKKNEGRNLANCFEVDFNEISLELEDNFDVVLNWLITHLRQKFSLPPNTVDNLREANQSKIRKAFTVVRRFLLRGGHTRSFEDLNAI